MGWHRLKLMATQLFHTLSFVALGQREGNISKWRNESVLKSEAIVCFRESDKSIPVLTHWGRVMHICDDKLTVTGSDNGLSPGRRQAIIWTNAGILLGTSFSEIVIEFYTFSFKKMHSKMSYGKWRPFCLGLNELNANSTIPVPTQESIQMSWYLWIWQPLYMVCCGWFSGSCDVGFDVVLNISIFQCVHKMSTEKCWQKAFFLWHLHNRLKELTHWALGDPAVILN